MVLLRKGDLQFTFDSNKVCDIEYNCTAMASSDLCSTLKKIACDAIDSQAEGLAKLSDEIWRNPELNFEERHAHKVLTNFLEKNGFETTRSFTLETAFKATYGSRANGPNVTFISEYDALPSIGHACGHNLIAEVGVAAGIGLMAAMKSADRAIGQVTVMGTPAEEGGGGKIKMIDAGAFSDVNVAMMSHPFPANKSDPKALAIKILEVTYEGKASHAAGYPWEGVNALDAAVMCYTGLSCARQQIQPDWRIHCVILEGGVKVNIIPEKSVMHIGIRAPTDSGLRQLERKVNNIIESAAVSTGCTFSTKIETEYSSILPNQTLVKVFDGNLSRVQSDVMCHVVPGNESPPGSTDMGNVTHVVPGIHPMFYIGGTAVNHSREFTDDAGHPRAQPYALIQAKALAMTGVDVMMNKETMAKIKTEFDTASAKERC